MCYMFAHRVTVELEPPGHAPTHAMSFIGTDMQCFPHYTGGRTRMLTVFSEICVTDIHTLLLMTHGLLHMLSYIGEILRRHGVGHTFRKIVLQMMFCRNRDGAHSLRTISIRCVTDAGKVLSCLTVGLSSAALSGSQCQRGSVRHYHGVW